MGIQFADWRCREYDGPDGLSHQDSVRGTPGSRHTTLASLSFAISSALKPNSANTSSVCSPNSGGRAAILLGVRSKTGKANLERAR
jgi:hypothetical protein